MFTFLCFSVTNGRCQLLKREQVFRKLSLLASCIFVTVSELPDIATQL